MTDEAAKPPALSRWASDWMNYALSSVQAFSTITTDPDSVVSAIGEAASSRGIRMVAWDCVRGMRSLPCTPNKVPLAGFDDLENQLKSLAEVPDGTANHRSPADAIRLARTLAPPLANVTSKDRRPACVFVMLNFFEHFEDPLARQELENACAASLLSNNARFTPIHFVQAPYDASHMWWCGSVTHWLRNMPLPLMTEDELRHGVVEEIAQMCRAKPATAKRSRGADGRDLTSDEPYLRGVASALRGVSRPDAAATLRYEMRRHRGLTEDLPAAVAAAVAAQLASLGTMEVVPDSSIAPPESLGGIDRVVARLEQAAVSYTPEAAEFHLDPPKGLWLCGVEGSGKTEAAKTASVVFARRTQRPWRVIRVRCGAFYGGLVGDTEKNWYEFESRIAAFGECIVFFDSE